MVCLLVEMKFLGKTFFKEKGFPEPFPKTFLYKKGELIYSISIDYYITDCVVCQ